MAYKGKKKKAWDAVKRYVRENEKDCYTCGRKNLLGKNASSGHFIPVALTGSNNTLAWEDRFIHLQCSRCNGAGQGMQVAYRIKLVNQYGKKDVEAFEKRFAEEQKDRKKAVIVKDWDAVIYRFECLRDAL